MTSPIRRYAALLPIVVLGVTYVIRMDPLLLGFGQTVLQPRIQLASTLLAQHKRTIEHPATRAFTNEEINYAALELARAGDTAAEEFAVAAARSNQSALREIAATVLGYFTSATALRRIKELIDDPDPQISERAIGSLCEVYGPARDRLLRELVGSSRVSARHRFAAIGCQYRLASRTNHTDDRGASELLKFFGTAARETDGGEKARLAFSYLVFLAPSEPETLLASQDLLRRTHESADSVLLASAFRHLSSHPSMRKDISLAETSLRFVRHHEPAVRAAALSSFAFLCPNIEQRMKAIEQLLTSEKQLEVRRTAWVALSELETNKAHALFNQVRSYAGANEVEQVESVLRSLRDPHHKDPCDN